mmetsp:Transcript_118178/g.164630  ORF Transcript_118178/g.164630 Transcript_118178/m.164630 type:complete len:360 (-) Transcript_118178:36-1115(-)
MGGMAIKDWCVTVGDLTGVVHDDDLGLEGFGVLGGVVLGVGSDVTSLDILDGKVLNVETNVVTGLSLLDDFVMHLDGFDLSGDTNGTESGDHTGLEETSLNTTDGNCSNTTDLVDILEGKSESLILGSLGGVKGVEGLEKVGTLVPVHVLGLVDHVITIPSRDGDEVDLVNVVTNTLKVRGNLRFDFVVSGLGVLDGRIVHLVDGNDHLLDTHGEGEESVLLGLTFLGETRLELTSTGSNDEDGGISLRGTSDHVLDEISVTWCVNDGVDSLLRLEFPESDINGDTTLTFGLELVKNPSVLESTLTHLVGFLLELGDGSLIDTTTLVDQVTGGGGFAGIDVTDNDEIKLSLLFTHVDSL